MIASRAAFNIARRSAPMRAASLASRSFSSTVRYAKDYEVKSDEPQGKIARLQDIKSPADLIGPGAKSGEIPSDLDQSTGLERYELLGKMEGIDVFDLKPLDASRRGTMQEPIMVKSGGEEQYAGCTGFPADSHIVSWVTLSLDRPIGRCFECGNVYKMDYIGPDPHAHHDEHDHGHHPPPQEDVKTFADYVKPEYWHQ